jgi:nucleoside-diphosphate-sugar epimerase
MYTIFGANGFIGSHLVKKLDEQSIPCFSLGRNDEIPKKNLGHIIYCIGITADFRSRPYDTVEAHVCRLLEILKKCEFDSFTYLSSVRVYKYNCEPCDEESPILINSIDTDDLYNISKIMGEAVCFASGKKIKIIRLSNVYGNDTSSTNFLSSIIRDAVTKKKIILQTSLDSEKDYVSIQDVTNIILKIVQNGRFSIYNVASGKNITNFKIVEKLQELTKCEIVVHPDAKKIIFPNIKIQKIQEEFSFSPSFLLDDLHQIKSNYTKFDYNKHDSD